MELKVWVDGIQRIVCGVTENTSCQDVVYALAHATGKTGRFTLSERWRSNERLLAPQDKPLKILIKWGEYSNDVQFILQRSVLDENKPTSPSLVQGKSKAESHNNFSPMTFIQDNLKSPDKYKDIRKSLTFAGGSHVNNIDGHKLEKIGIVRGVPKTQDNLEVRESKQLKYDSSLVKLDGIQKREAPPYREPPGPQTGRNSPHQRALPPYREPPPPNTSPLRSTNVATTTSIIVQANCRPFKQKAPSSNELNATGDRNLQEAVLCNAQYRDLVRLVNYQREKLSAQQSELTKFDAEIIYWETKTREQQHQLDMLNKEKRCMETASRQNDEQLRSMQHTESEFDVVRQQEKTLKSEISLLRSKLANCETELLQCKNKIRLLMEELHIEKMAALRDSDERQHLERALVSEVERLQHEIELARQSADMSAQCGETLKREVSQLETAISERKRLLEQLLSEMKEANLQSLVIAPPEELKNIVEGPHKPGVTRKMVGSPRQLENAVPTSKNPHGVWV